jgi:hypothetical protein
MPPFQGFIGGAYATRSVNASSEDTYNLYVERAESPGAATALYGTPGLSPPVMTLPDTPVRATLEQDGRSWAIGGGTYYETTTGVPVPIGQVVNDGLPATIDNNGSGGGSVGFQNFIVSGKFGYIHDLNAGTFSQIAAPGFPQGSAIMGGFMDGYFFVLTKFWFQISKLADGTQWNGLDKGIREISQDNLSSMLVSHRELWLFGTKRTEGWYNNGNTSFPFAPISGVFLDQGIAAPWSAARVDNSTAWLSQNRDGDRMVMQVDQLAPKKISNWAVDESLRRCPTVSDFIGFAYQEGGHLFYILTSAVNNLTWAYDPSEGPRTGWAKRSWFNPTTGRHEAILARCHAPAYGQHWVGDRKSGNIYNQSLDYFTDNGTNILAVRQFPHLNNERKGMIYDLLQIDGEAGVGLQAGQGAQPKLMLNLSDDGGHVFGGATEEDWGREGDYLRRAMFWRLGWSDNRVFRLSCSEPIKKVFTAAYLRLREGKT